MKEEINDLNPGRERHPGVHAELKFMPEKNGIDMDIRVKNHRLLNIICNLGYFYNIE